nr:MAG TPA: hypothetical protein [Caudoviricetes sp.]
MDKDKCYGCRCQECRWRGAGSLFHYNEHGEHTSRCSWCSRAICRLSPKLPEWKTASFACKGFERKR